MTGPDFVTRELGHGDTELIPNSGVAREYLRLCVDSFGAETLTADGGLFVETSRDPSYLADTVHDLRAQGFTVADGIARCE